MCNVICMNLKCSRRQPNSYCSRSYPCSEYLSGEISDRTVIPEQTYNGIPVSEIYISGKED